MRSALTAVLIALWWASPAQAAAPVQWMVKLTLEGKQIEGSPLEWNKHRVYVLGRDGHLWDFAPGSATGYHKTQSRFRSYPPSDLRAALLRELGREYEVSGTGHYLVAHPSGQRDKWARRFEDLYRSFVHYVSVRGFKPAKPPFPLIGIVCKDRRDFSRYTAAQGGPTSAGVLGYYSPTSNRIVLYDMGAKENSRNWEENASVIVHEATHQTAFNTGIHSRYTPPPLWVIEGLATMFEARGVNDCRAYTRQSDRLNRGRLQDFKRLVEPKHQGEMLASLVASDKLFRVNAAVAYAEAWALSFYLVETQPRKYTKYLALCAKQPPFTHYSAARRTADFTSVFGDDWRMLEAHFLRFMRKVK